MRQTLLLALLLTATGCASVYSAAPPPNLPEGSGATTAYVPTRQLVVPSFFYVTDRAPQNGGYGAGRSNAMAFGQVRIGLAGMQVGDFSAYMQGVPISGSQPRYALEEIDETVRFPGTPIPFALEGGVIARDRNAIAAYQDASDQLRGQIADELAERSTGKVVLYVHGFNNDFDTGAFNLLELWAASGWRGVPVMFSWPTQQGGLFSYFADTQDGAFSVYHFKETLRLIASTPGVETVTVMAHSHGASIATTALRELLIEARGADISMYDTYRIETLILAAPDIDLGVMEQRLVAEMFGVGFGQINVYMNADDNALGLAGMVFGNRRFGTTSAEDLSPESRAVFHGVKSVHFIMVEDARGDERHNYFRLHPGVLADIAMTIRTDARPADPERPLEHLDLNFWNIDRDYRPALRNKPGPSVAAEGDRN